MSARFPSQRARGGQPPDLQAPAQPSPLPRGTRPLDVTVTILSLSGVHARDTAGPSSSRSFFGRKASSDDNSSASGGLGGNVTTTVVATFANSSSNGEGGRLVTHVPSLPLPSTPRNRTFTDLVRWPEQDAEAHSRLSSFTFRSRFPEGGEAAPQLVPVQISISRNGRLYRLGSAHLFVNGEEGGHSVTSVPVVNFDRAFRPTSVASRIGGGGGVPMMRLKDDTVKCGLAERATLELLVRVQDPSKPLAYVLNERRSLRAVARQIASPGTVEGRSAMVSRCNSLKSTTSSDASWIYDPNQAAVVRRRMDAVEEAREEGESVFVGLHPGGILQVGSTGIEATPAVPTSSLRMSRQAKQDSCQEARAREFESNVAKNDSHETHSTGSVSSYDESLDDTYDGESDGESDFTSSQFSRYTEASESDLAVLLRKISSRERTYDSAATDATFSSVKNYRGEGVISRIMGLPGRMHGRLSNRFSETFEDEDDGSVDSCGESRYTDFTRDATELTRNSTKFKRGRIAAFARAKEAIVPPKSTPKGGWTSRLICCAGPGDTELLTSAIHEDLDANSRESLDRGRSGLSGPTLESAGTDRTPW